MKKGLSFRRMFSCVNFLSTILVLLLFTVSSPVLRGQCGLRVLPDTLRVEALWDSTQNYLLSFQLSGDTAAAYRLSLTNFRETHTNRLVEGKDLTLSQGELKVSGGATELYELVIKGFPGQGLFVGNLQLAPLRQGCLPVSIPVVASLKGTGQVTLADQEQALTIRTVNRSWLYFLVPPRLKNNTILFSVENHGNTAVRVSGFSLFLKGVQTMQAVTEDHLSDDGLSGALIPANERTILSLALDRGGKLSPDQYKGNLEIYLQGYTQPLALEVDLYVRSGIFWALIALLVGVLVGIITQDLQKNQMQMDWMKKLVSLRTRVKALDSARAREMLQLEITRMEDSLGENLTEEDQNMLGERFEMLQQKLLKIRETESVVRKIRNTTGKPDDGAEELSVVIDLFLAGDFVNGDEKLAEIRGLLAGLLGADTKNIFDDAHPGKGALPEAGTEKGKPVPTAREMPRWLRQVLAFFTETVKVRYFLSRPVVYIILLGLVLLWGLQEVYFSDESSTFGANGIYDHLKLFGWGAASNIFSWQLVGKNFLGAKEGA